MTASDPFAAALRLLTGRDYSSAQLASRLQQKGFAEADVAATLERCRQLGYLDDGRFAQQRARTLLRSGRAVGWRLLADLQRHGLTPEEAAAGLEEVESEFDQNELFSTLLQRRYPGFDYARAEAREQRRVVQFFLRRGFPLEVILSTLRGQAR